ncbi:hypothetical protein PAECIP111894_02502 [Paenibacillus pseudetheri]|uniref:Uncharacterized protein n=1 Tax=Paenibacillus pseudetheri TaxID=2897682 RepID=A0ABM9BBS9_9BACL|nr:hypothetical protein PAECIP111894_02502 [Paenibacillus pseudetheri]
MSTQVLYWGPKYILSDMLKTATRAATMQTRGGFYFYLF